MRNCRWCDAPFTLTSLHPEQRFCSKQCREGWRRTYPNERLSETATQDFSVSTPYGSAGFDDVVAKWWRNANYPVGLVTGSFIRPSTADAAHRVRG